MQQPINTDVAKGINIKTINGKQGDFLIARIDISRFTDWTSSRVDENFLLTIALYKRRQKDQYGNTHTPVYFENTSPRQETEECGLGFRKVQGGNGEFVIVIVDTFVFNKWMHENSLDNLITIALYEKPPVYGNENTHKVVLFHEKKKACQK